MSHFVGYIGLGKNVLETIPIINALRDSIDGHNVSLTYVYIQDGQIFVNNRPPYNIGWLNLLIIFATNPVLESYPEVSLDRNFLLHYYNKEHSFPCEKFNSGLELFDAESKKYNKDLKLNFGCFDSVVEDQVRKNAYAYNGLQSKRDFTAVILRRDYETNYLWLMRNIGQHVAYFENNGQLFFMSSDDNSPKIVGLPDTIKTVQLMNESQSIAFILEDSDPYTIKYDKFQISIKRVDN